MEKIDKIAPPLKVTMYATEVLANQFQPHILLQRKKKKKFEIRPNEYRADFENSIKSFGIKN